MSTILKLDLQHFAEDATQAPTQTPQQAPQLDINDLVSNISNKINDTLNQRLSPIEQKLNQPAQPTKEQLEAQNESIRQQFENNPAEFVRNIQQQAEQSAIQKIKAEIDPDIQETKQLKNRLTWQDTVRQFTSQNPEATKHMQEISQVLQENPGLMQTKNPLDVAYKIAVSSNLIGNGGIVQGVLGNEEYKKQIMSDPTLREQIIQEYQTQLNNGTSKGLPPIMGNTQGGSIPASGGQTPLNLKEAKQAALRRFQGQ